MSGVVEAIWLGYIREIILYKKVIFEIGPHCKCTLLSIPSRKKNRQFLVSCSKRLHVFRVHLTHSKDGWKNQEP